MNSEPGDSLEGQNVNGPPHKRPRKQTSAVHQFFTLTDDRSEYMCNICSVHLIKSSNSVTSNLRNHLERLHPDSFEVVKASTSRRTSKRVLQSSEEPFTKEIFSQKLIKFLVTTDQPYTIVENPAFRELINFISKDKEVTKVPGRTKVTQMISDTYKQQKQEVVKTIQEADAKVSFVLDLWTSSNKLPLLGIICRFVDKNYNLQSIPLDLIEINGYHSGENIAHCFLSSITEVGLEEKILSITTDNASNMGTFFIHLTEGLAKKGIIFDSVDQRVRCLAHILNLSAHSLIEEAKVSVPLDKLHSAIREIGRTPQRREVYYRKCGERKLLPGLDSEHRWNSTYDMLTQAKDMRHAIDAMCLDSTDKSISKLKLTDADWSNLVQLTDILGPLKRATLRISHHNYPSIWKATTVYQEMFSHFDALLQISQAKKKQFPWIEGSVKAAKAKLLDYYGDSGGKSHGIGFILHPSYKTEWFRKVKWNQTWINEYEAKITQEWNVNYKKEVPICEEESNLGDSAEAYLQQMGGPIVTDELQNYLREPLVPFDTIDKVGVLEWWKGREHDYPDLSKMLRDYMSVAGSGVAVESFFSSGTDVLTDNRQRINGQHLKELMCSKKWFNCL